MMVICQKMTLSTESIGSTGGSTGGLMMVICQKINPIKLVLIGSQVDCMFWDVDVDGCDRTLVCWI